MEEGLSGGGSKAWHGIGPREDPSTRVTWTFPFEPPLPLQVVSRTLAHLDAEASQHGVGVEQVSDGVVDVAAQGRVGDRGPQGVEGLLQEPQAGLNLLGLRRRLAEVSKQSSVRGGRLKTEGGGETPPGCPLTSFFSQTSKSTVVWGTIAESDRVHPSLHDF